MNYEQWAQEYNETINQIDSLIGELKTKRKGKEDFEADEIKRRIAYWRLIRNECLKTANHLMKRHRGVA